MDLNLEQEKLGNLLIDGGLITEEELEQALEFQDNVGGKLGEILVKLDFVSEEKLMQVIAEQQNMETVELKDMILPEDLIQEVPREVIEEQEVIPVAVDGDKLKLAIHDPFDYESIEEVQLATDFRVEPALAPRDSILKVINQIFYSDEEVRELEEESLPDLGDQEPDVVLERLLGLLEQKDVLTNNEIDDILRK